ncbi:hypothetical protein [Vibrio ulleungensis]|uniref:Uncharacterized protein n=1 Tax=Vibrio ulleungensis TaxID=2807619 RepID=A0ABS2HFR9_9VIBR|nr:hypothetical protein [Vibrio ulleungensis]MBM7034904.1 hypothetical protein [Vibrio ulleungensis]
MKKTPSTPRCGQCRQFTRSKQAQTDYCEAWDQPTVATQAVCGHFMPKTVAANLRD